MSNIKEGWTSISLPINLKKAVEEIYILCGYRSIAEYVRDKVRDAVSHDKLKLRLDAERRADNE